MTDELYLPDQGDGSYRNPVLCCDYSDPDVIRVGDTYYMTASSFNYVPGLPILTSADLVNWRLVNYALPNIPEPGYEIPRHACGVWAPAIRWHDTSITGCRTRASTWCVRRMPAGSGTRRSSCGRVKG